MSDEREFNNVYTIPPNYTDSGKLMGGMLETRNTVEAAALLLLAGYPELMWLHLPATISTGYRSRSHSSASDLMQSTLSP